MDAEELFKSICELMPSAMERHHVPGVAFGIVAGDREFTAGFGVTNIDNPLPVDDSTLFQIGSITKTYTATAIARLAEDGRIDLDEPVRRYLPEFRMRDTEATERVTVRHLLIHTAGWVGDYFEDTGAGNDALKSYVAKMAELPQIVPVGTIWSYNNSAFALAGRVIEGVTGKTYEAALSELVLEPLGLRQTFIFPTDVMTRRFAAGHGLPNEPGPHIVVLRPWPLPRSVAAAGGLIASIKDVLRYARFHLGDGTNADGVRVMSQDSLVMMRTPIVKGDLDQKMGLAWHLVERQGSIVAFKTGGTLGQVSLLRLEPDRDFAISFLTNSAFGALAMADAAQGPLALFTGFREEPPAHIAMTAAQLSEYIGRYTAALTDAELGIASDEHLVMQMIHKGGFPIRESRPGPTRPPTRLAFIGTDLVSILDPPFAGSQALFLRDDDGRIAWLRIDGRIHRRL